MQPLGARSRVGSWAARAVAAVAVAIPVGVVVTAFAPATLVAEIDVNPDPEVTEMVATPFAVVPAAAQPVADRVRYGELTDEIVTDTDLDGRVFFLTIAEPWQSVLSYWVGVDTPEVRFITYRQKYGDSTPAEYREVSLRMMRSSSQVAQYNALARAGYDVELVPGVPQVEFFYCFDQECDDPVPAAAVLQRADVITAVNGTPVASMDELTAALNAAEIGATVDLDIVRTELVERDGAQVEERRELTVEDVQLVTDGSGAATLGFQPFDNATITLPFEIRIDTDQIGGPSAGLAFTLTLLDELTGGDLLGGNDVAVTGTIGVDGSVGPIGGLVQKAAVVRQAGIEYFIVPTAQSDAELERVRAVIGDDVELILVATLDEALAALERIGGDPPEVLV